MSQGAAAQTFMLADATGYPRSLTNAPGFFWSSPQANSQLQVAVNNALTAGSIRVSVGYGLTNTLIQNTQ